MTTDELKKEAEEYGIDLCAYCRECEGEKPCQHKLDAMHGYQDGLKAREKRIAELEKENAELRTRCNELFLQTCEQAELIEKMKSPLNCKHSKENGFCIKGNGYCICDKWEIAE